ncbi:hypothetical protein ACQPYA_00375 [Micromonospora sp. CA-263727]|uniref:hypothetical protein n=1 Tax=Micromonospora sp. CA-263727 TaxID=3239967 RepID=UPI003D8C5A21
MPENKEDLRVMLGAFEGEAQKWEELADLMASLRGTVDGLWLNWPAFFCGNPASAMSLSESYNEIHGLVATLMTDAEAEFTQLAEALRIARDLYQEGEDMTAADFVRIYGE